MRWSKIKPSLTWTFVHSWLDAWDYSISHCFSPAPGPTQCFQIISKSHFLELGHQKLWQKAFSWRWTFLSSLEPAEKAMWFGIFGPTAFQRYSICWVFQSVCICLFVYCICLYVRVTVTMIHCQDHICSQKTDKQTREDIAKVIALCLSRLKKCGFSHVWGSLHIQHTSGNISLSFQGSRVPWES